jgi:molecular chaperone DnaK
MRTIGIDLGTTNTVFASNASLVLPQHGIARAQGVVPSIVAFPPSGEPIVGEPARQRRGNDPANTIASSKRVIGRAFASPAVTTWRGRSAVEIVRNDDGRAAFRTRQGLFTPVDVASIVLREIVRAASIDPRRLSAVVTVPVAFDARMRAATLDAARAAGFAQARAIEEPIATAIAYLARSSTKYAAVYDLGGGTFDLAIVDCSTRPFKVVASAGDAYLGGDDVDHALAEIAAAAVLRESGWDLRSDREVWERLVMEAERAKLRLSLEEITSIDVAAVDPAAPTQESTIAIDRRRLRELASTLTKRTFAICDEVLAAAKIHARDVDAVFLAGGSVGLPGLREDIGTYFGKRPRSDLDPLHVVSIGASLAAARPELSGLLDAPIVG